MTIKVNIRTIEWYDKALKVDPNYFNARTQKCTLGSLGKNQEAIEWYDKALKVDPNYFNAPYNKGASW